MMGAMSQVAMGVWVGEPGAESPAHSRRRRSLLRATQRGRLRL